MTRPHGTAQAGIAISGVGLVIVLLTALRLSPTDAALLIALSLLAFGGTIAVVAELQGIRAGLDDRSHS